MSGTIKFFNKFDVLIEKGTWKSVCDRRTFMMKYFGTDGYFDIEITRVYVKKPPPPPPEKMKRPPAKYDNRQWD